MRLFNLLRQRKGRRYPVIRYSDGSSLRQTCFAAFEDGWQPGELAHVEGLNAATLYTYHWQWRQNPSGARQLSRELRRRLKEDTEFAARFVDNLSLALRLSHSEVMERIERPYGLYQLTRQQWQEQARQKQRSTAQQRMDAARAIIRLVTARGFSIGSILTLTERLLNVPQAQSQPLGVSPGRAEGPGGNGPVPATEKTDQKAHRIRDSRRTVPRLHKRDAVQRRPLKRFGDGRTNRKYCFDRFGEGCGPEDLAAVTHLKPATVRRYFYQWRREPAAERRRNRSLQEAMRARFGFAESTIAGLGQVLGLSRREVLRSLGRSPRLHSLLRGEYPCKRSRGGAAQRVLEEALLAVVMMEADRHSLESIQAALERLENGEQSPAGAPEGAAGELQ